MPVAASATKDLLRMVREFSKSGSDIIVEEDLANIFGRNRIERSLASSFKTAVSGSGIVELPRYTEAFDIILQQGAGPTVLRSIKDLGYLATVIQISLLTLHT